MTLDTEKYAGKGAGTMRITILKSTVCDGKYVTEGDDVEASDKSARFLINSGKAVEATEKPKKKAPAKKPALEDKALGEDDLETRD